MPGEQVQHLGRVEAVRFGKDLGGTPREVGEVVEARAVRQRGGVEQAAGARNRVHVGEVAPGHLREVAVREHGPLRSPRRPARVKDPRERLRRCLREGSLERILDVGDLPRRFDCKAGPTVPDYPGYFAWVQLRVDGYRGEPRPPGAVQGNQVLGAVGHGEGDPLSGGKAEARGQPVREARGAARELAVARPWGAAAADRGTVGIHASISREPSDEVHRSFESVRG